MDLIYCDKNKVDIGVMKDFSFDLAFGVDENDFELTVDTGNNVCADDYFVYIENTEYGGIIDAVDVDTANKQIKYKGRTYHGILNSKIIIPSGNYYTVSGDANTILGTLINDKLSLGSLFTAKSSASGITISNYQFKRYVEGYNGIIDMLSSVNAKLHMEYINGNVELSAIPIVNYTDEELNSDHVSFQIQRTYNAVNHLVCLGQGTLSSRYVLNLYCDANGNISTTQTFTGIDEYAQVYDYPNVESQSDLDKEGRKRLKELNSADKVDVNLDDTYEFDVGDVITATDDITGISVTRRVTKKIVKISNDVVTINYKIGEK